MNRLNDLQRALTEMGSSAEAVARTMRSVGVQGVRNAVRVLNPVVKYLQNTLCLDNLYADVSTGRTLRVNGVGLCQETDLPPAVMDFLTRFNRGEFPDLELPRSGCRPESFPKMLEAQ